MIRPIAVNEANLTTNTTIFTHKNIQREETTAARTKDREPKNP